MNFILTLDYELFGDGSGDVFKHMIAPTEKILKICNHHNFKTTIFFETVEYLQLKKEWENGNKMGYQYNPIEAIEKQLQEAATNGHDIQLHIHPQWVNAKYRTHKWEVDLSSWRLGGFRQNGGYTLEQLLLEGKNAIENIIHPVLPDYKCIALRAGGYNIMPSDTVFAAMKKTGLKVDSSVFPGGYETSSLSNYDYRHVPVSLDYWWGSPADITRISSGHPEILEVPIFALPQARWRKVLSYHRLKSMLLNKKSAASSLSKEKIAQKSTLDKIRFLREKEAFTWDICLFDSRLHSRFLKYIEHRLDEKRNSLVLIGHPKSPFNEAAFLGLIRKINNKKWNFLTITQFYQEVISQTPSTASN